MAQQSAVPMVLPMVGSTDSMMVETSALMMVAPSVASMEPQSVVYSAVYLAVSMDKRKAD